MGRCTVYLFSLALSIFCIERKVSAFSALPENINSKSGTFSENKGQIVLNDGSVAKSVKYYARFKNAVVYFRETGISYVFSGTGPERTITGVSEATGQRPDLTDTFDPLPSPADCELSLFRMDMDLLNTSSSLRIEAEENAGFFSSFYTSGSPVSGVQHFRRLRYADIYKNTDLVFYFTEKGLKYDFIIKEGGDYRQIKLKYSGADALARLKDGSVNGSAD
jgi:hypothetical protein